MSRAATKRSLRRTAMRRGSELVPGTVTISLVKVKYHGISWIIKEEK